MYANAIRWQPAFKQLIYRNDDGDLIVTISQNSIGNAITELLGVVVKRVPDADAYAKTEPALIEKLGPPRQPTEPITQYHMDLAYSAQNLIHQRGIDSRVTIIPLSASRSSMSRWLRLNLK